VAAKPQDNYIMICLFLAATSDAALGALGASVTIAA